MMMQKFFMISLLMSFESFYLVGSDIEQIPHMPKIFLRKVENRTPYTLHLIDKFHEGSQCAVRSGGLVQLDYEVTDSKNIDADEVKEEIKRKAQFSIRAYNQDNKEIDDFYINMAIMPRQTSDESSAVTHAVKPLIVRLLNSEVNGSAYLKHDETKAVYIGLIFTENKERWCQACTTLLPDETTSTVTSRSNVLSCQYFMKEKDKV